MGMLEEPLVGIEVVSSLSCSSDALTNLTKMYPSML